MRIGLVAPPWLPVPPPAYGGIEAIVDRLARGLVASGHDVLLAATGDSTCPVPRVEGLAASGGDPGAVDAVVRELRHVSRAYAAMDGVDLVHDHTVSGPLLQRERVRVPLVTTNHGTFTGHLGELAGELGPEVTLVAISCHQASLARGIRVQQVIHHGLDVARVPVGRGDGAYACFLGRMSPDKGPREAVLIARRAGIPLLLAAKMREPSERAYFDECVAPLLGPDAEYVGELGETDKDELLGGAIALLNPIQWPEPFGLVMIEALAAATPVVATTAGSAPEIVDDGVTGFLRDAPADLADALGRAAELDRAACRLAAATRFSTERMVAEHVDLYTRLLNGRGGAPFVGEPAVEPVGRMDIAAVQRSEREIRRRRLSPADWDEQERTKEA
jgi:glycosyltransferase involved in cell wall biosynthesis